MDWKIPDEFDYSYHCSGPEALGTATEAGYSGLKIRPWFITTVEMIYLKQLPILL